MMPNALQYRLKSIRARVTRNPLTTAFFLVGLVYCIAQAIIQSFIFVADNRYNNFLSSIIHAAQVPPQNHTDLPNPAILQLEMCSFIPHDDKVCSIVFPLNSSYPASSTDTNERGEVLRSYLGHDGSQFSFNQSDNSLNIGSVILDETCIKTLLYPDQHFQNARREDITLMVLQVWLFGISVLAMCYDSVPHVLALLGARILFTAWSIYAVWRTSNQQNVFHNIIEAPGTPCHAVLFPTYFQIRMHYQIPDLILNCTALAFTAYLSWALVKVFQDQSVKTVGAPKEINRMYKYYLALQVCLQLEAFVLMAWMGLWLDQFNNSYIRYITNHFKIYTAVFVWYAVFLGPWMLMGWWGIRLEKRILTGVFIVMGLLFTSWAGIMFYSQVYRWTFYAWPFFGCFTVAALILLFATFPLSIVCWRNFNKGLAQYLHAESVLASSHFATEAFENDIENVRAVPSRRSKKAFLDSDEQLPTYYLPELRRSNSPSETATLVSDDDEHVYRRS
ncbi:hypothetical protein VKT23_017293 [Stygiomarasmius scandens]|uniref:Transmembrane protein n=1 Tax=Marasmiellus scandens TaxID=2682957 RepID=A0ABR1ISK1_9AGAR